MIVLIPIDKALRKGNFMSRFNKRINFKYLNILALLMSACSENDIPKNANTPSVPAGDFRGLEDFASLRIEDMRSDSDFYILPVATDMAVVATDMAVATDIAVVDPDMAMVVPDMAMVVPDMAVVVPDMAVIVPDMAMVVPDMAMVADMADIHDHDVIDDHDHGGLQVDLGMVGNIDLLNFDATCGDASAYQSNLPQCAAGSTRTTDAVSFAHIADDIAISYTQSPPSSGDHRGMWAKYGEYSRLPPQRWIHNLEHGAIVFLYHPCAPAEQIQALRDIARAQPNDADTANQFRWILTPYPNLPSSIAVVAWTKDYAANCINTNEIQTFINDNYRHGREDVSADGSYATEWISR
jgi:hypothetical protein